MCNLLNKDTSFKFDDNCLTAFNILKEKLITTPILIAPNWKFNFKIMCDVSDYVLEAVLGQRKERIFQVIHYVSKVLNET